MSNILLLDANSVIDKAPLIRKNQSVITKMFEIVSKDGIGMGTIAKLMPIIGQIKK